MRKPPDNYYEQVYAGWLGKIIGVRMGAPIENWSHERIRRIYGLLDGYPVHYREFASDDDLNGPFFFLQTLFDYGIHAEPEKYGRTWLNYVPTEHGFFWWGGYGNSTEHTAYLNLRNAIPAPRSGSIEQNGRAVAEQIGGQIFIDTWGLIAPGNPPLAAEYARKAASVSHDGNGVFGGMFVAACIAAAFVEKEIGRIIDAGLSVLPPHCEYRTMVEDVRRFHDGSPDDWERCLAFVRERYGTDRYPGACHIIPNAAVIILSLLYGGGSFDRTLAICCMCGWDTDCNAGNVGSIMGLVCGMEGMDYKKWIAPVRDILLCSSVLGAMNILDVPWMAARTALAGHEVLGVIPPEGLFRAAAAGTYCHFELPHSTHGFRAETSGTDTELEYSLVNTGERSADGGRSLKLCANVRNPMESIKVFRKTYYRPGELHDDRYCPAFSPIAYPGQHMSCALYLPEDGVPLSAALYALDINGEKAYTGSCMPLAAGQWTELSYRIPRIDGGLIGETGVELLLPSGKGKTTLVAYLDEFHVWGDPDYSLDFTKERVEPWSRTPVISQCTYTRAGIWSLAEGNLTGSAGSDSALLTGSPDWEDYRLDGSLIPLLGESHRILFRVQGAIRFYSLALATGGLLRLAKTDLEEKILRELPFPWKHGREYRFTVKCVGGRITASCDGAVVLEYVDSTEPFLHGQIGFEVRAGSRCVFGKLDIKGVDR